MVLTLTADHNTITASRSATVTITAPNGAPARQVTVSQLGAGVVFVTVRFNPSGGTVSPTMLSMRSGRAVGTLPVPTRANHTFTGWFTAQTGGRQIGADEIITANVTFWARWTANQVHPTSVSITGNTRAIIANETLQLTANVQPTNATDRTVTWSSSNTAIATVNNQGLVMGVAAAGGTGHTHPIQTMLCGELH